MWLFEVDQDTLQPSLKSSMMFLYVQSNETVSKWTELIPFWPSKKTRRIEGNGKAEQKQEDKGLSKKPEN